MPLFGRGRTVVVTGAGGGIGSSIALHLARCGYRVIGSDIKQENLDRLRATASAETLTIETALVDAADENAVRQLFQDSGTQASELHGVVLVAGVTKRLSLLETTVSDFDDLTRVNIKGTFLGLREAGERLRRTRGGGSIVIVSSINAFRALPSQAIYSASKAAVNSLVASAAVEYGSFGVRVNAIAPGAILTEMNPNLSTSSDLRERVPLGRVGLPDDLNGPVEFLLSEDSKYMTGATLVVDGGLMHAPGFDKTVTSSQPNDRN